MAHTAFTITATAASAIEDFARKAGVELAPLAASVGLDVGVFQDPAARIALDGYCRLLHILETITGDDCIGLRYSECFRQGNSGPFGFAILNAPTLREAMGIYRTYQRLIADYSFFDVDMGLRETTISWRYASLVAFPHQFVDFRAAMACKMLRSFTGQGWHPSSVALVRAAPRSASLHRRVLAPRVGFEAPMNCITFPSQALQAVSVSADSRLYEMMLAACETQLAQLEREKDVRVKVKEHILAVLPSGDVGLARIAPLMAVSARSLQRRLAEAGTSFERLLEDTRRELSDQLLGGDTPIAEIGYLCGYSNASAYSRAAKGWYGMPPAAMRKLHRTPAV
jgi:AraC-like DNA-binding protein